MMAVDYDEVAGRHGFSRAAVEVLARAVALGNGTQAQFNHPEFGGMGQWMPGMVMIGEAFNHVLKARVDALCVELAGLVKSDDRFRMQFAQQEQWWPAALGRPTMVGEQNGVRYAYFQMLHRLVIMRHNKLHSYDTEDHHITGVSQQQTAAITQLVFHTDRGIVREQDLREITS